MGLSALSTDWWNHERNCSVVAALREKFGPHATTQRRNEKLRKRKSVTENEIHRQVMDAALLILLKHGFNRVVNGI